MKTKIAAIALAGFVLLMLNGCIPSLHPIYTEDKLVLLKELPGIWQTQSDATAGKDQKFQITTNDGPSGKPETWTFKSGEEKNYLLIHEDQDGYAAAFDIHLIKLGKHYFMDFFPTDMPVDESGKPLKEPGSLGKMNSLTAIHLLAVHTFAKLEITDRELKISMFDPEFLRDLLKRKQIRIKHEETENGYVLTASPEDLQKFAEKYADVKEAFLDEPTVLKNKL